MNLSTLVGREEEQDLLDAALSACVDGSGSCVVVEGPAGIGKSRLLAAAAERAEKLGLVVASGRATKLDRVVPLTALLTALHGCRPPVVEEPDLAELSQHEYGRFWLVDRLGELVETYCRRRALVIMLDDLQWADEVTAMAMRTIVPELRSSPVAWLLARRRSAARTPVTDTLDWLIAEGASTVRLDPLPDETLAELCAKVLGAEPGPTVLAQAAGCGGNPFLLAELLNQLRAAGRIQITNGVADTAPGGAPPAGFVTAVDQQLRDLSGDARRLLEAGSVLGRPFTLHEVAGLLSRPALDLVTPTTEAVHAGALVDVGSSLGFRQDLVRDAIYHSLPGAARQAFHRTAVTVLLAEGRSPTEVTEHFLLGAHRADAQVIALFREAVTQVAPSAPGAAADLILRMLELLDQHDPSWLGLIADAIRLLASAGRLAQARALGEKYLSCGLDPPGEASIVLGLTRALHHLGLDSSVVHHTRRVLDRPGVPPADQAQLLAIEAQALLTVDGVTAADLVAGKSVELGQAIGADSAVVAGNLARSAAAYARADLGAAVRLAGGAVSLVKTVGGEARHLHPRLWLARALVALDRMDQATAVYTADQQEADQLGTQWSRTLWHRQFAELRLATGELGQAETEAGAGLRAAEALQATALMPGILATLCHCAVLQRDLDVALSYLRKAQRRVDVGPGMLPEELLWALAVYQDAAGEPAAALETVAVLSDAILDRPGLLVREPLAAPQLVRIALRTRVPERAEAVVAAAAAVATRNPRVASLAGSARHAEGLLRRDLDALRAAVTAHRSGPRPLCRASALEDLAVAEQAAGDRTTAIALLDEAFSTYLACAARGEADRVRGRLRSLGVRRSESHLSRRPKTGWASLTPSELRVARVVAKGSTNRDAASELFVSPHTVDSHLRHAFTKLGVSSRVELTRLVMAHDNASEVEKQS